MFLKICEIKKETSSVYYKSIKQLFLEERNALLAIKWKSVFDSIEKIMNLMENTAKKTEAVVIKSL